MQSLLSVWLWSAGGCYGFKAPARSDDLWLQIAVWNVTAPLKDHALGARRTTGKNGNRMRSNVAAIQYVQMVPPYGPRFKAYVQFIADHFRMVQAVP